MPEASKTARLLVRYGKHRPGETIRGDLAAKLIARGMATDITPAASSEKPKKKPKKKAKGAAPENKKADDGFDPNAG